MKTKRKTATKKIKKPNLPKEGKYNNLEYESFCELSLLFFCEELKRKGYIKKVERSPSYILAEPTVSSYTEKQKKGSKTVSQNIQQGVTYTPDYDIYFTEKAIGKVVWILGSNSKYNKDLLIGQKIGDEIRVCCEVKPDFSRNSTTPKSVQSMKWLYQRHGIFVNLFRPNNIFERLFTPEKYLLTERGTIRRLKFIPKSLDKFLSEK